jgi:hypothetical protein
MILATADMWWKYAALVFVLILCWQGARVFRSLTRQAAYDRSRNTKPKPINDRRYRRLWVIDREDHDERPTGT